MVDSKLKTDPGMILEVANLLLEDDDPKWRDVAQLMGEVAEAHLDAAKKNGRMLGLSKIPAVKEEKIKAERAPLWPPMPNPYKEKRPDWHAWNHLVDCDDSDKCETKYQKSPTYSHVRKKLGLPVGQTRTEYYNAQNAKRVGGNPYDKDTSNWRAFDHLENCTVKKCKLHYHDGPRYLKIRREVLRLKK
jgi:hypothetical protein